MIRLPLRISQRGEPAAVVDADGKQVSLESLVGIVGALAMVLNAAKMANRSLGYAIDVTETLLADETQLDEQRLDEGERG